jgi:hypothetical protein
MAGVADWQALIRFAIWVRANFKVPIQVPLRHIEVTRLASTPRFTSLQGLSFGFARGPVLTLSGFASRRLLG